MQWFVNIVDECSKRKEWIWKMYKKKETIKILADHYISSSNGIESFQLCGWDGGEGRGGSWKKQEKKIIKTKRKRHSRYERNI